MTRNITATTGYATKRQFQEEAGMAWITMISKDEKGEEKETRHLLKDVMKPGVQITVRNGVPTSCPKDRDMKENSQYQPTWQAVVTLQYPSIVIE